MAKAYYSTVFEQPAEDIWAIVRDFNNYSVWLADTESRIENGKSGDAVGAIRNVRIADRTIRQRLLAHSDIDRVQTYAICDAAPFPVENYQATLRITPIVTGTGASLNGGQRSTADRRITSAGRTTSRTKASPSGSNPCVAISSSQSNTAAGEVGANFDVRKLLTNARLLP